MAASEPVIFYHLWPVAGWEENHARYMTPLLESGLLDAARSVTVGWAAPPEWLDESDVRGGWLPLDVTRVVPLRHGMNEVPTLDLLHAAAKTLPQHTPMLYLHCRGTRYRERDYEYGPVHDHNAMMLHFLVERWQEAVDAIAAGFAVAGCNVQEEPHLHVSGNMWWADSTALAGVTVSAGELEAEIPRDDFMARRNVAEFWLGRYLPRRAFRCLHSSGGIHHYQQRYPRALYAS